MSDKQYSGKEIICHLTQIKLVKCPVENCMWSDGKGGCNFSSGSTPEILGTTLGMTDQQIKSYLRKGRVDISRFIVLDSYVTFIKNRVSNKGVMKAKIDADETLAILLKSSKIYNILVDFFELDHYMIVTMLKSNIYNEYIKSVGKDMTFSYRNLLGIRKQYVEKIKSRVKTLIPKRTNGNKPRSITNRKSTNKR